MKTIIKLLLTMFIVLTLFGCSDKENLILVNPNNIINQEEIDESKFIEVDDCYGTTTLVDKIAYNAYLDLKKDLAENHNIELGIDSAYRSVNEQIQVMNEFIETYGEEYAKKTVAQPGTSEHHTGLAIDIVIKKDGEWVVENEDLLQEKETFSVIHSLLHKYGFILRYLEGKENITGYDYEPWHIRYVGKSVAKQIYDKGLTLEEYLEQ